MFQYIDEIIKQSFYKAGICTKGLQSPSDEQMLAALKLMWIKLSDHIIDELSDALLEYYNLKNK